MYATEFGYTSLRDQTFRLSRIGCIHVDGEGKVFYNNRKVNSCLHS